MTGGRLMSRRGNLESTSARPPDPRGGGGEGAPHHATGNKSRQQHSVFSSFLFSRDGKAFRVCMPSLYSPIRVKEFVFYSINYQYCKERI